MRINAKHLLIMVACCLIPLAAFGAISILQIPANTVLLFGLALLCPLSHLLLMKLVVQSHSEHKVKPKNKQIPGLEREAP